MTDFSIVPVEHLALRYDPRPWPFAIERRAEIDAHFAELRRSKPALWNGRILLLYEATIAGSRLDGAFLETDYASLLAWRDWDFPDPFVKICFGAAVLRTADDALLLGQMGPHTANAGQLYFPTGTLDPHDRAGDRVDLEHNVLRELAEETGLAPPDVTVEPGWHAVLAGPRIAMLKGMRSPESAVALRDRILAHLAREEQPELADIRIVRSRADLDPRMPPFLVSYLNWLWG